MSFNSFYINSIGDRKVLAYLLSSTQAVWYKANFMVVMFVFLLSIIFGQLPHFLYSRLTGQGQ